MPFLTIDQIHAKHQRGERLTPWETSVYRLNYRPDGTRYSTDPKHREQQYEHDTRIEHAQRRTR